MGQVIDPRTGQLIDEETGQPIDPAFAPQAQPTQSPSSIYGDPYSQNTIPNTIADPNAPMENRYTQNQNIIGAYGTELNNEALNAGGFYGNMLPGQVHKQDQALNELRDTPGYTPGEAGQINTDYSQFNTGDDQYANMRGNPNAVKAVGDAGAAGEGAMLNQYQANLGGEVREYAKNVGGATDQYGEDLGGAVNRYGSGVGGAVSGLKSGIKDAQDFSMLDNAVNREDLAFDPNGTEHQMTDADVQNIKTAAGTRIGNASRNAEDTMMRQAAEAGNTSPLALAAARERLVHQSAADQGDSELNADIAARQAQFGRAQAIEGQREGAVQTQAGMQATAGTTEEAARQAGAGLTGTADIQAQKDIGAAGLQAATDLGHTQVQSAKDVGAQGIDAANRYGQFSTQTQGDIANKQYGAAANADAAATGRAATESAQRYGQGVGSTQATAKGAQTVGDARMAGNQAYRTGVAGQENLAAQGGNEALKNQNATYNTTTQGLNQSANGQGNFINGKASFGDSFMKNLGGAITSWASAPNAAKGDIITEPQTRTIGEAGPELVIPVGRYGGGIKRRPNDPAFCGAAA